MRVLCSCHCPGTQLAWLVSDVCTGMATLKVQGLGASRGADLGCLPCPICADDRLPWRGLCLKGLCGPHFVSLGLTCC